MGVSRTTAWRWWRRFQDEGRAGLVDRSSVARTHPRRTSPCVETRVRIARMLARRGPVWIGHNLGLPASTVGRVLARHRTALLRECDPLTGALIRATRRSANRYEHPHPGSLGISTSRSSAVSPTAVASACTGEPSAPQRQARAGRRLRAHRDRRPLPAGLRRDPRRREGHHLRRLPGPGSRVLCRPWHPRRTRDQRQREELPALTGVSRRRRPARHHLEAHPTALPLDQRESRTPQPHPRHRVGPTHASSTPTPNAPPSCPPGSSTTTWTDPTSASAANDPSTASTTLRVSTPSSGDQVTTMARRRALGASR